MDNTKRSKEEIGTWKRMKKKYDFSKEVKGKFCVPKEKISLPLYLNQKNQKFYL